MDVMITTNCTKITNTQQLLLQFFAISTNRHRKGVVRIENDVPITVHYMSMSNEHNKAVLEIEAFKTPKEIFDRRNQIKHAREFLEKIIITEFL